MTELSNVYDLIHRSPVDLKKIASNAVAVSYWHWNLNQYRVNDNLNMFKPGPGILLRNIIPDIHLPSTFSCFVEKYINRFGITLDAWLLEHFDRVIFDDFDDFVYDFDGTIDYVGTAKRMIACDRIRDDVKFEIACMYCFENEVRKIWPSVSEGIDLDEIDFNEYPQFFYWICLLRNELHKIPNQRNGRVAEMMFDKCPSYNRSALEYFWNHINYNNRLAIAKDMSKNKTEIFVRFFLTKLTETELFRFVNEQGNKLIYSMLTSDNQNKFYVFPTWMYIKNKMNESTFNTLVEDLLKNETNHLDAEKASESLPKKIEDWSSTNSEAYFYCEVWRNAPENLKRSAIENILQNEWVFIRRNVESRLSREVRFLSAVLLNATFQERYAFWHTNWLNLIDGIRMTDLHRIMNLCFGNDNNIIQFKQNTMSKYEKISSVCIRMLKLGFFKQLDDLLSFCCPEIPARRELKQRVLHTCFLDEHSILEVIYRNGVIKEMNEFIDSAYDNSDQAAEFKNRVFLSPETEGILTKSFISGRFEKVVEFVSLFVSDEQVLMQIKKQFFDDIKNRLNTGFFWTIDAESLQRFLVWCLGSMDEVSKFKESVSISEFLRKTAESPVSMFYRNSCNYPPIVDEFLIWYFDTKEKVDEFKNESNLLFEIFSQNGFHEIVEG